MKNSLILKTGQSKRINVSRNLPLLSLVFLTVLTISCSKNNSDLDVEPAKEIPEVVKITSRTISATEIYIRAIPARNTKIKDGVNLQKVIDYIDVRSNDGNMTIGNYFPTGLALNVYFNNVSDFTLDTGGKTSLAPDGTKGKLFIMASDGINQIKQGDIYSDTLIVEFSSVNIESSDLSEESILDNEVFGKNHHWTLAQLQKSLILLLEEDQGTYLDKDGYVVSNEFRSL